MSFLCFKIVFWKVQHKIADTLAKDNFFNIFTAFKKWSIQGLSISVRSKNFGNLSSRLFNQKSTPPYFPHKIKWLFSCSNIIWIIVQIFGANYYFSWRKDGILETQLAISICWKREKRLIQWTVFVLGKFVCKALNTPRLEI
jgi:hypothetical protein